MKIVDVAEFYSELGGGVRTYIQQKLAAGARNGHEILIIAPGAEDREQVVAGSRIRWVRSEREPLDGRYFRFGNAAAVHAILDQERPDVIECSSPWQGARIVGSWRGNAAKVLVLHNDPVAVYGHSFLDRFMNPDRVDRLCQPNWNRLARVRSTFDDCVVAGEWLARRFSTFGISATAIPFGIDKRPFSPALRDEALRRKMLLACGVRDHTAPLLLAVSRHHPEKRLSVLIDAMSRLRHRRPAGLFLVGDGPLRGWVERIAAQVDGVHVAGTVSHDALPRFLASADAFVHAGAAETFGLVIAEGLCSGLPMVLPDRGGAAALAGPGYAELYGAGDAAACAAGIERLLARERTNLSASAMEAGEARVQSDQAHFANLFDHYRHLVDGRGARAIAA